MKRFISREDVERIGRIGVFASEDERGTYARQLSSFWLYVDPDDHGYRPHAIGDGFWESWITLWMDRNVPTGARVLDIGANHGYYSFFLASKGHDVYAVEPQKKLAQLLKNSNKLNNHKVGVWEVAVSDKSGTIDMMVPTNHGMNATISNEFSYAPNGYTTEKVKSVTLDDFNIQFGFIKVDAEGAEDLIWAGSEQYREDFPETLWLMEWRWDRYKEPEKFATELFKSHNITAVTTDGREEPIWSVEHLGSKQHEDWMLVLRAK